MCYDCMSCYVIVGNHIISSPPRSGFGGPGSGRDPSEGSSPKSGDPPGKPQPVEDPRRPTHVQK